MPLLELETIYYLVRKSFHTTTSSLTNYMGYPETKKTQSFECVIDGRKLIFIDTPGFDDSYKGDGVVLQTICQRLSDDYQQSLCITAIIYLHRIKDEKFTFTQMRNLDMLKNLCGIEAFSNVALATTFWDELPDAAKGEKREQQLLDTNDMWGFLSDLGARNMRFYNTRESALAITREVAGLPPVKLQVQEEIVDQGLQVSDTTAGVALHRELHKAMTVARKEMDRTLAERDRAHEAKLNAMYEAHVEEMAEVVRSLEQEQALLQAHGLEQVRLLEQRLEDDMLRKQRRSDRQIAELDRRLAREKEEHEASLQRLLEKCEMQLRAAREAVELQNGGLAKENIEALNKGQREYEKAQNDVGVWLKQQDELDAQLRQAEIEYLRATSKRKPGSRQKIEALEEERKRTWSKYYDRVMASIGTAAGVAAAMLAALALV